MNYKSMSKDTKTLTVRNMPQGKTYVPGILIQRKYLQNLGFNLYDQVRISPNGDGTLNIQKI